MAVKLNILKAALDFLMPRSCLVCGRTLGLQEKHICLACEADMPFTRNWEAVHNPMANQFNAMIERQRADDAQEHYSQAASLIYYHGDNPYKKIPQALKYWGNIPAGRYFAAMLGRKMAAQPHWADVDMVIPVPLHWRRRWRRGYNQAEVIAREIARELGAEMRADILRRPRRTPTQTSLHATDRLKNVSGAFEVKNLPSDARHILLVDDTFTTGATLAACHETLRRALGPSVRISVATLAVVSS